MTLAGNDSSVVKEKTFFSNEWCYRSVDVTWLLAVICVTEMFQAEFRVCKSCPAVIGATRLFPPENHETEMIPAMIRVSESCHRCNRMISSFSWCNKCCYWCYRKAS